MEELILGVFSGIFVSQGCLELPCQGGGMGSALRGCGGSSGIPGVDPTRRVCFGSASRPFKWVLAGG